MPLVTVDDAYRNMSMAIDNLLSSDTGGTLALCPTAGGGKTHVMIERLAHYALDGHKVVYSAPNHQLAAEIAERFKGYGIRARHRMSVLRVLDEAGQPVCKQRAIVEQLSSVGTRIREGVCDNGCPYRRDPHTGDACLAYSQTNKRTGDIDIIQSAVIEYQLASEASNLWALAHGERAREPVSVIAIDEFPSEYTSVVLGQDTLRFVQDNLREMSHHDAEHLGGLLRLISDFLASKKAHYGCNIREALSQIAEESDVDCELANARVIGAYEWRREYKETKLPHLLLETRHLAMRAYALGKAILECAHAPQQSSITQTETGDILLGYRAPWVRQAIRYTTRGGKIILADATAWDYRLRQAFGPTIDVITSHIRYPQDLVDLIHVPWDGAARSKHLTDGKPNHTMRGVYRAIASKILAEEHRSVCIITDKPSRESLDTDLSSGQSDHAQALVDCAKQGIDVRTAHYPCRGIDSLKGASLYAIVGDPHPNIDHTRSEAMASGIPHRAYHQRRVSEEIEQAIGRARLPRRGTKAAVIVCSKQHPDTDLSPQWIEAKTESMHPNVSIKTRPYGATIGGQLASSLRTARK